MRSLSPSLFPRAWGTLPFPPAFRHPGDRTHATVRLPCPDLRLLRHADRLGVRHLHGAAAHVAKSRTSRGPDAVARRRAGELRAPRIGAGGSDPGDDLFGAAGDGAPAPGARMERGDEGDGPRAVRRLGARLAG